MVVGLEGEFDLSNAHRLDEMISSACAAGRHVIVDLSSVPFMDSSAVAVLLRCRQRFGDGRFSIVVAEDSGPHRVLTITGIDQVIPMSVKA